MEAYHEIKTEEDIAYFKERVNGLHDGHVQTVEFLDDSRKPGDDNIYPGNNSVRICVIVTSAWDTVVEIVFSTIYEWQFAYRCGFSEILDCDVSFDEKGRVVWTDDYTTDREIMKDGSYVIAESMLWRILHAPDL